MVEQTVVLCEALAGRLPFNVHLQLEKAVFKHSSTKDITTEDVIDDTEGLIAGRAILADVAVLVHHQSNGELIPGLLASGI